MRQPADEVDAPLEAKRADLLLEPRALGTLTDEDALERDAAHRQPGARRHQPIESLLRMQAGPADDQVVRARPARRVRRDLETVVAEDDLLGVGRVPRERGEQVPVVRRAGHHPLRAGDARRELAAVGARVDVVGVRREPVRRATKCGEHTDDGGRQRREVRVQATRRGRKPPGVREAEGQEG